MPAVYIREAQQSDCTVIEQIINQGRAFLKAQGLNQWQGTYPNKDTISDDIARQQGYVLLLDNSVVGYAAVIEGQDPIYDAIENGEWLNSTTNYAAIHRFVISNRYHGQKLAQRLMSCIFTYFIALNCRDFRIDTHPNNVPMQAVITGNGFHLKGHVYINDGQSRELRWAYQIVI